MGIVRSAYTGGGGWRIMVSLPAMCGIAGIWGDRGDIWALTRTLTHRGPDDHGVFENGGLKLGSARLAVIDPGRARQPMAAAGEALHVVFNGTIYNFRELRGELRDQYPFALDSDTEVILAAWRAWGTGCFERFNGNFAIALWDGSRLVLARDRFGEKPLYWTRHHGTFLFASEIKALLEEVPAIPRIEEDFAALETGAGNRTLFQGIESFPPAHFAQLEHPEDPLRPQPYWTLPPALTEESPRRGESDLVEELRALLIDSVRLRLVSDVPLGLFLSGGLDSALIACIAQPDRVFSCHFPAGPGFEEISYAKMVAEKIDAEHTVVQPTWSEFRDQLPRIIRHLDEPVATPSPIAENALARAAKGKVKVVLGGQGADECFGGYVRYLFLQMEQELAKSPQLAAYHPMARHFWGVGAFGSCADRYLWMLRRGPALPPYFEAEIRDLFQRGGEMVDRAGYADLSVTLPSLLTMNDRASAAEGLENRCPFLDHRLVEFAFALPPGHKIRGLRTKHLLRKAARGLVPDPVIDRTDKMGLVVPVNRWLDGPLAAWSRELEEGLRRRGFAHLEHGSDRGEFDRNRYTRICLELWFREVIDKHSYA